MHPSDRRAGAADSDVGADGTNRISLGGGEFRPVARVQVVLFGLRARDDRVARCLVARRPGCDRSYLVSFLATEALRLAVRIDW
jgi:hypothetical protein